MKSCFIIFCFSFCSITLIAQSEESLVIQTIESAYVGGFHNGGSVESIRKGFHPSFVMFRQNKNEIITVPLEEWIKNTLKSREESKGNDGPKATAQYQQIGVVGNAANVTLDLHRGDKRIFTDHLLLYKFEEGWRIVSKSFYRHP